MPFIEVAKQTVNEQAKRQIIRKAAPFLIHHEITSSDFATLQNTAGKTLELALKKLTYSAQPCRTRQPG